jgi:hypothetical protein
MRKPILFAATALIALTLSACAAGPGGGSSSSPSGDELGCRGDAAVGEVGDDRVPAVRRHLEARAPRRGHRCRPRRPARSRRPERPSRCRRTAGTRSSPTSPTAASYVFPSAVTTTRMPSTWAWV